MITGYKIQSNNNESVLFLFIDSVEFSISWLQDFKDFSIKRFIAEHKLNFNGNKVILVLSSGIMITLLLTGAGYNSGKNVSNVKYVPSTLSILNEKLLSTSDKMDNNNFLSQDNNNNNNNNITSIGIADNILNNTTNTINKDDIDKSSSDKKNNSNIVNNDNNNSSKPAVGNNSSTNTNTSIQTTPPSNSNASSSGNNINSSNTGNTSSGNNNSNIGSQTKPEQQNEMQVTIKRSNGQTVTLGMTDYLIGVVASEMPASFNEEALKAQAVLARTYALKRIQSNLILTDTTSTQVYKDNNQLRALWGNSYDTYYKKIRNAVVQTNNEVCLYNGSLIDAVYHSTSNGMTEDAINVWGNSIPYLVSVASPTDTSASSYLKTSYFDNAQLLKLFGIDISSLKIEILTRNQSGRVDKVMVNEQVYSGIQFRNLLGIRSSDFDISYSDTGISITTRGFGHGVGMSQYGANGMANQGYTYKQILTHYYKNITIEKR